MNRPVRPLTLQEKYELMVDLASALLLFLVLLFAISLIEWSALRKAKAELEEARHPPAIQQNL